MKKVLMLIGAAVLVASAGLAISASAQDDVAAADEGFFDMPPGPGEAYQDAPPPDGRPFGFVQRIKEELGLTDEQVAKLEALRLEHMKARIEIGAKMKVAGLELATLMKEHGNDQAVLQKSSELTALRNQAAEMAVKHQLERRAVFTAEQWDKVGAMRPLGGMMQGRGPGMMNRGRGMMPGRGMRPGRGTWGPCMRMQAPRPMWQQQPEANNPQ